MGFLGKLIEFSGTRTGFLETVTDIKEQEHDYHEMKKKQDFKKHEQEHKIRK